MKRRRRGPPDPLVPKTFFYFFLPHLFLSLISNFPRSSFFKIHLKFISNFFSNFYFLIFLLQFFVVIVSNHLYNFSLSTIFIFEVRLNLYSLLQLL